MEGNDPLFAKGLDATNVREIARRSTPTTRARFVRIEEGRIELQLPEDFPLGQVEVQLVVLYYDHPLFSNSLAFLLEGGE
jgi:hypothetical protein